MAAETLIVAVLAEAGAHAKIREEAMADALAIAEAVIRIPIAAATIPA